MGMGGGGGGIDFNTVFVCLYLLGAIDPYKSLFLAGMIKLLTLTVSRSGSNLSPHFCNSRLISGVLLSFVIKSVIDFRRASGLMRVWVATS